jgi:LemA protein
MKRGLLITIGVILLLVLSLGGCVANRYNQLVNSKEAVNQRWAQVDNQLQRRSDLIPRLVETVKGFAAQESRVLTAIADARAKMAGARSVGEKIAAGQEMDGALSRLLVVVENYPQLKSNENFMSLQDELAGTENRLATERMRYNETVQGYNVLVKRFPTNIFAAMFNFAEAPYYPVAQEARSAPGVHFDTTTTIGGGK